MTSAEALQAGFKGCPGVLFARAAAGEKVDAPYVLAIAGGHALMRFDDQLTPMTEIATVQDEGIFTVGAAVIGIYADDVTNDKKVRLLAHVTKVVAAPEADAIVYYEGTLTLGLGPAEQVVKIKGVHGC